MLNAVLVNGNTREQDELVLAFLMTNHSNEKYQSIWLLFFFFF